MEERRDVLSASIAQELVKEDRKAAALVTEREAAAAAEAMAHRANLIVSNLYRIPEGAKMCEVEDWEAGGALVRLDFSPKFRNAREEADAAFDKARRLRRGSLVVAELLLTSAKRSETLTRLARALDEVDDEAALEDCARLAAKARVAAPKPAKAAFKKQPVKAKHEWTGRTFESPAGVPILVGRSRRENDKLSVVIARDGDYWLHARGAPGAHVLLQLSRSPKFYATPEPLCLQMAADLAAFYSDLRTEGKAPVMYTSPKHVSKPPKAPPGAVTVREELGTILGRPDDVPQSCKDARAQSGDYGAW